MKKILFGLLLVTFASSAQVKVKDLPTTTTGAVGDFLIKDDVAGIPGSTKKISITNFLSTYIPSVFVSGTANYHTKFITATTIGNANLYDKGRAVVLPSGKIFASEDTSDMKMDFGTSALPRWRADLYYNTNANSFITLDTFNIALSKDASGAKNQSSIQLDDDGVELVNINIAADKESAIHLDTIRTRVYHTDSIALVSTKTAVSGNFQIKDGTEGTGFILQGDDQGNSTWVTPSSVPSGGIGVAGDIPSFTGTNVQSNIAASATSNLWLRNVGALTKPAWSGTALPNSATVGDIMQATSPNTYTNLSSVAAGSHLRSAGIGTANVWSTTTWPNSATTGDVIIATSPNTYTNLAAGAAGTFMRFAGAGVAPVVSTLILPNSATTNRIALATSTNTLGETANLSYDGTTFLCGSSSVLSAGSTAEFQVTANASGNLLFQNNSSGASATTQLLVRNNNGATGNMSYGVTSSGYAAGGIYLQNQAFIRTNLAGISIAADNASGEIRFYTGGSNLRASINSSGRTFFGGSTSATALVHLGPGTATANTAPLKGTAGTLLSTPESLAKETSAQGWYGTSVALNRYSEGGAIADFTSDANNTSTTETDLYSYTTKASTLAATGEKIIVKYSGTFNDITATSQVKVLFAGTTIFDSGALTVGSTGAWVIEAMIIRTGASTARAVVNMNTGTATTMVYTTQTDLTGLTFTNTNILKVTGTAGGAGGGDSDITAKLGTIFWHGAANN